MQRWFEGTKGRKKAVRDTGERYEGKMVRAQEKRRAGENGYPEDDMIQLDIDMVQLVEDTETIRTDGETRDGYKTGIYNRRNDIVPWQYAYFCIWGKDRTTPVISFEIWRATKRMDELLLQE